MYPFVAALLSLIIAQLLKPIFYYITKKEWDIVGFSFYNFYICGAYGKILSPNFNE